MASKFPSIRSSTGFGEAGEEQQVGVTAQLVDITTLDVDAIVNAANDRLRLWWRVRRHTSCSGPELARACAPLAPCPTGDARITPAFRLPCRYVIHAVGPIWQGGKRGEADLLASAYRNAMRLAGAQSLTSIAFPAISTGIFGYPLMQATETAVNTVRSALQAPTSIRDVIFACFNPEVLEAYAAAGVSGTLDD